MYYYRGKLIDFNSWHEKAKEQYGIKSKGIIGDIDGVLRPDKQKTTSYSEAIKNPNGSDDYIWLYGKFSDDSYTKISYNEAKSIGWFNLDQYE